jgi:hypothetical protein
MLGSPSVSSNPPRCGPVVEYLRSELKRRYPVTVSLDGVPIQVNFESAPCTEEFAKIADGKYDVAK